MSTRCAKNFILIKKDLADGFIKKHRYKDLIEYWIYQGKKSHIFKLDGKPATLNNIADAELKYIIVCNPDHISEEKENTIMIKGCRFDEYDLENYLKKTNRGHNG